MIELEGTQRRLTIFIGESDHHGHTPLATEIVQRAHSAGVAGEGVAARGACGRVPHPHLAAAAEGAAGGQAGAVG